MSKNPSTRILALDPYGTNPEDTKVDHAGKKETSLMLALRPELVHMNELVGDDAFRGIGKDCVEGSAEFGTEYFKASVEMCASMVKEVLDVVLEDERPAEPDL